METKNSDLLTIEDLSQYLKMPKGTLYNIVSQKQIPFYKPRHKLYFKKSEIDTWIDNGKVV